MYIEICTHTCIYGSYVNTEADFGKNNIHVNDMGAVVYVNDVIYVRTFAERC